MENIYLILILLGIVYLIYKTNKSNPEPKISAESRSAVIDSCGLIDGRIIDLAKSGFITDKLIVPEVVLRELQLLADGKDSHKRERARYGLDVVKELQANKYSEVIIDRTTKHGMKTDDILIEITKKLNAGLYTTDYNLSKLAEIEGIRVLNVNELAQQLRPIALPGEIVRVKIMQKGSGPGQGVGYLDDGTMVVIEGAVKLKGKLVKGEVAKVHQTVAGKMIFANLIR